MAVFKMCNTLLTDNTLQGCPCISADSTWQCSPVRQVLGIPLIPMPMASRIGFSMPSPVDRDHIDGTRVGLRAMPLTASHPRKVEVA